MNDDARLERDLEETYAASLALMGLEQNEARESARKMLHEAKELVVQLGLDREGPNYGDRILKAEASNPQLHDSLEVRRADGVRDEDIRWWWNQHPLERIMIDKADEFNRMAGFIEAIRQSATQEEAASRLWRAHPKFGDPANGDSEDRPLPIELKPRIAAFIEQHANDPEGLRSRMQRASSFNALVRTEIRAGHI